MKFIIPTITILSAIHIALANALPGILPVVDFYGFRLCCWAIKINVIAVTRYQISLFVDSAAVFLRLIAQLLIDCYEQQRWLILAH